MTPTQQENKEQLNSQLLNLKDKIRVTLPKLEDWPEEYQFIDWECTPIEWEYEPLDWDVEPKNSPGLSTDS